MNCESWFVQAPFARSNPAFRCRFSPLHPAVTYWNFLTLVDMATRCWVGKLRLHSNKNYIGNHTRENAEAIAAAFSQVVADLVATKREKICICSRSSCKSKVQPILLAKTERKPIASSQAKLVGWTTSFLVFAAFGNEFPWRCKNIHGLSMDVWGLTKD